MAVDHSPTSGIVERADVADEMDCMLEIRCRGAEDDVEDNSAKAPSINKTKRAEHSCSVSQQLMQHRM